MVELYLSVQEYQLIRFAQYKDTKARNEKKDELESRITAVNREIETLRAQQRAIQTREIQEEDSVRDRQSTADIEMLMRTQREVQERMKRGDGGSEADAQEG
ncbi:uncharacterized protein KY384_003065 [Bacidia gigantensis]|uniref:uncharacterized protein n=1 Tax=Bacidia gigantensis TaxID=2732470 RepID=UPI001D0506E8|nr:uncharacterized protein KY384_003065 [Bacidia gigantensis]KAG8531436.1 hypothetical protein KY384_003065 [Bacidia gigantensis]